MQIRGAFGTALLFSICTPVLMKAEPNQAVSVQPKVKVVDVIGAVYKPGSFQLAEGETLSVVKAIAKAGGLGINAAASKARISRIFRHGDSAERVEIPVDLKDILAGKQSDIPMQSEDILIVPSGKVVCVFGAVREPGSFQLAEGETLSVVKAIARAGGLGINATASKARIIRHGDSAERVEIAVNLKDILAGKQSDIPMQPEDILFVPGRHTKELKLTPVPPGDVLFVPDSYANVQ